MPRNIFLNHFQNGPTKKWDFPSDLVFTRLNAFLQRLRNIEEVYETTFEFLKLEKLVFQGIRGGVLGASSLPIHENFIKSIKMLAECKYDPIDISDKSFEMDFKEFQTHITDCERRIGTIFCQAFDYCAFPESATKLFEMFGFVLKRPLLQSLISSKYKKLLEMFSVELDRIKRIYDAHMITLEICHGARPVAKNMPPIAGQLKWAKELKERLQIQMKSIRAIHHMYMGSDEVKCVCQKSDEMMELLHNFCDSIYTQWSAKVDTDCKLNLAQPLLLRKQKNFLKVNFNKQLVAVMREVKYLTMLDQDAIPPCAADIFAKHETFQKYVASLYLIVSVYNQVQAALLPVEFSLMKEELMNIDEELACAEYSLCWSSEGIWEYIQKMSDTIQDVQSRIELAKSNVKTMQDIMNDWIVTRMFERKDSKIDSLLDLEGTSVALQKKYSSISETGKKIDALITENKVIFRANECSESWIKYTDYIDDKVLDGFYKVIYVSLNFLLKNMSAEAKHPLFEVCFALEDGNTAFHPSMSYGISDGFYYLIENLIYDVYSTATLIPRISMTNRISYMVELEEMSELTNMRKELMTQVLNGMKDAQDYHEVLFMKYGYLWKDDHDKVMELFLMYGKLFKHDDIVANRYESIPIKPPTLKEFKEAIDTYEELYTEVKKLKNTKILQHWLQVDFRPFKHTLLNIIKNGAGCLSKILLMVLLIALSWLSLCLTEFNLRDLEAFIGEVKLGLTKIVVEGDSESLLEVMGHLFRVKNQQVATDTMFDPLKNTIEFLTKCGEKLPDEVHAQLKANCHLCFLNWQDLPEHWNNLKKMALQVQKNLLPFQIQEGNIIKQMCQQFEIKQLEFREKFQQQPLFLFSFKNPYEAIDKAQNTVTALETEMKRLYNLAILFEVNIPDDKQLKACQRDIVLLTKLWDMIHLVKGYMDAWSRTRWKDVHVDDMVRDTKKYAKDIKGLDNEVKLWDAFIGLENMVKNIVTCLHTVAVLQSPAISERHWQQLMMAAKVDLKISEETTLEDLMKLNLHKFEDEVHRIVDRAKKELWMENILHELENTWSDYLFEYVPHGRTDTMLLKQNEMLMETLQDNQVQLSSLMASKYIAQFLEEVSSWQQKLFTTDSVISTWLHVQHTWSYLECIFVGSEDIHSQLPEHCKCFNGVDSEFKEMMADAIKTPKVIEYTNKKGLPEKLEHLEARLAKCEKALVQYLETKRVAFPRFYFVSSADLLDILSNGNNPVQVTKHLSKLFDSISNLKFRLDENDKPLKQALGMYSNENEYVKFDKECDCSGQVALAATQIWWTSEVGNALVRLEEGYENAMKDYFKKQIDNVQAFMWQSQLRHRWDNVRMQCFANICDAQFQYSYEYLGNTPRLVITPLTDRCYITLTQSLHLIMGGAPAGPAGTGKTETTKDLGRALGVMVYVFNCSEQMDYKSCGDIYKGLAQTGAWGCFDEFNRISVEVLSVIAVQVKCIHAGIKGKQSTIDIGGHIIKLIPTVGVFITMNPGYAGRAELPENLKALFRPCAMVVPDFELICEIMLVAEGFTEARLLARKFITLYRLCKELLSKQDHYDWGLRAIKSVLVVAGSLKREDPGRPEDQVLMRALRDFNIPKIVMDDKPVFMGLIGDLFPALDVPRKRDMGFEKVLKSLNKTYQNMKRKHIIVDLDPKAVTCDELFGIINPTTREWKDGLFSCVMREIANITHDGPKWMVLDGDIDPMWIESLNTVMDDNKLIDCHLEFSKWWVSEFKTIKFPSEGTVFDYFIDSKSKKFIPWTEKVPKFTLDPNIPLQASLVHTAETIRIRYFSDELIERKRPVMLVGNAGSGKSVLMGDKLRSLSTDQYIIQSVPFNFCSAPRYILEKNLEKKAGRNYGPPGQKRLIYFIIDMNMPEVDKYFTVAPHTLIRQHMDHGHWYDRQKLTLKNIHNCQYVACMNPTAGSFTIDPRLQRHFCVFAVSFPGQDALFSIYSSIFSQHLDMNRFSPALKNFCSTFLNTALMFHQKISTSFLPTAVKFHYVFNLRDVSNIFQETNLEKLFAKPNIYCHFAQGIGDPKYFPITDWTALNKLLTESLESYNEVNAVMNLVLFEDAMSHICRINRILESPRGNALLVGVGGSGKQSLSRLAASISDLEVFQITLRKGYGISDLKLDLSGLYMKAGVKNIGTVFLMTDSQVADETFPVLINDLLASGEIPGLFQNDEIEDIIGAMRNEVKSIGLQDTRDNCWKFFIDRVRKQLKVILCFSPVGSTLRVRARKFPALVTCTCIDWFHEWPKEALVSVSTRFLSETEGIKSELKDSLSQFMAYVHKTVNDMSKCYLLLDRRYNYTTPKTFLEQINLYQNLLSVKRTELLAKVDRLVKGLNKLESTTAQVDCLNAKLAVQKVELKQKNEDAGKLIQVVKTETDNISKEKAIAVEEELKVQAIAKNVGEKQRCCEEDLAKAEPALLAAQEALNTLNKKNLTELKSFGAPLEAVVNVTAAVMVLLATDGKIPKDKSWKAAKNMMAKVDSFLDSLINYNKENIPDACIKAFEPFKIDPTFEPNFIRQKSIAAAGLCSWCLNIVKFYEVYCDVKPKRQALDQANAELAAAKQKLSSITSKIAQLNTNLAKLTSECEKARDDKLKCQKEADATNKTISLANRLVGGLASEKIRWSELLAQLKSHETTLCGDVMLISAFVSYVGYFTKKYRTDLMDKYWLPYLRELKVPVPIKEGLDPLTLLTNDADVAAWSNQGLPSDRTSIENATILCNTERWPLIVDAQLQGIRWIKNKFGDNLKIIRLGQKGYLDIIENAVSSGDVLLIENISETIEPVLDPLLGRNTIKKGKYICIGDKEVEYHPNFRLILHTKHFNPHYQPEMQAQCTLINFIVTRELLAAVVAKERPDLEMLKVLEAKTAEAKITEARENYRPVSIRAALLFFILSDLNKINPIYQVSLKAFSKVFEEAIMQTEPADDVKQRVDNLNNEITYSIFMYTNRCLFERDKLTFIALIVFQILTKNKEINPSELDFLLRFPFKAGVVSPVDFLSNQGWGGIKALAEMDEFRNLDTDIVDFATRWKKFVESEAPEKEMLPQDWKKKSSIQKLCMMRCIRPDRMCYAIRNFVEAKLGTKYVDGRSVEFAVSFEESSSSTPMFFILSPAVDPLTDIEALDLYRLQSLKKGFTTDNGRFHNVSLGQGQEVVAEAALDLAAAQGHWVILQNIHLVAKWLGSLDKRIEKYSTGSHSDYRVFMSAEPAPTPESHIIPQGLLENSIKITNEPPTGMHANLHKALNLFNQETLEMCSKESEFQVILFALCYFHAVVSERRKFGAQGWNRSYPFNNGDLTICTNVLYNYLEANSEVPWDDLHYLFGEIMYGGHITDDWDRRLCRTYLQEYMQPEMLEEELQLVPGFPVPFHGYHMYIDEMLPPESAYLYGLHPNAEIGILTITSEKLFRTVLELQPKESVSAGGGGASREERVKDILDEILEKLPDRFNMMEIMSKVNVKTPFIIVVFQECERMNILTKEISRSLKELSLGLKGELTITTDMEELGNSLFLDTVPETWTKLAYPSLKGLGDWYADLLLRIKELETWTSDFAMPAAVWLSGFFNPQSFLTAIMQSTARKNEWPLDKMCLAVEVTKKNRESMTSAPRDGAFIYGLFMEGARWDIQSGAIVDALLKELTPAMPVIFINAIPMDRQETKNVYKTRMRGPTYVWTFNMKTKEKPTKSVLASVCLLLSV
ncbi:hypothetical protein QTP86_013663 [Hemibagrus guttatus]|nr:hypothetical protein QTP86_013663 [Hemibagrus guttatus]